MTTWVIGDIQGCLEPLQRLLEKIHFNEQQDQLWLAGDLVNRGPDSLGVLRLLWRLRKSCRIVLGNHDLHLLAVAAGCATRKRKDTFDDVLTAPDRDELLHWLQQQPLLHHDSTRNTVMTHAGIPPQWSLAEAQRLAAEVESVLREGDADAYFRNMYGNTPDTWQETLSGTDRLRTITNHFTRMRFINAQGALDLTSKEGLGTAPAGFMPWFAVSRRKIVDTRLIFGHWAALEGETKIPNILAVDTGCVWGHSLTALNLQSEARICCDCASMRSSTTP